MMDTVNNSRLVHLLLVVMLLFETGCTTLQEVNSTDVPLDEVLQTGDHIVVYEKTGRVVDMRYVLMDNGVIRGSLVDDGLQPVEVRVDDIQKIEAERIEAGRTTAAVIGGIVLLPIAALGAGIAIADQ